MGLNLEELQLRSKLMIKKLVLFDIILFLCGLKRQKKNLFNIYHLVNFKKHIYDIG